ncbi:MAG: trypsin-like serine protease [Oligoflexia bacterium]|nr:trypsin-like serine protease [Oligoflexia bacterium]
MKNLVSVGIILSALSASVCLNNAYAAFTNFEPGSTASIVGGTDVQADDPIASTTVMLFGQVTETDPKTGQAQTGVYICTASIISQDTLVSAGHCVAETLAAPTDPTKLYVVFGQALPNGAVFGQTPFEQIIADPSVHPIYGYVAHPQWLGADNQQALSQPDAHDISVIRFKGGLPQGYTTATLLPADVTLQKGEEVTLAGYGITNAKTQDGAGTLRQVNVKVDGPYGQTEMAVAETAKHGSCSGDSGGPAFLNVNGQLQLWGATSRGNQDCTKDGIYTMISAYTDFISQAQTQLEQLQ